MAKWNNYKTYHLFMCVHIHNKTASSLFSSFFKSIQNYILLVAVFTSKHTIYLSRPIIHDIMKGLRKQYKLMKTKLILKLTLKRGRLARDSKHVNKAINRRKERHRVTYCPWLIKFAILRVKNNFWMEWNCWLRSAGITYDDLTYTIYKYSNTQHIWWYSKTICERCLCVSAYNTNI